MRESLKSLGWKIIINIEKITGIVLSIIGVFVLILLEDKVAAVLIVITLLGSFLSLALIYSKIHICYYAYQQELKFYYDLKDNGYEDVVTINEDGEEKSEKLYTFRITMFNKATYTVRNVEVFVEQAIDSYLRPASAKFLKLKNGTRIYKGDIKPKTRELFTVCHWSGNVRHLPHNCKLILTVKAYGIDETKKEFML